MVYIYRLEICNLLYLLSYAYWSFFILIRTNKFQILEALTTEKCLERLSLERFEVLGDSFLKYAVARHSFLTYEAFDEGQLTRRRSSIVNNSNLYELAIAKKLQVKYLFRSHFCVLESAFTWSHTNWANFLCSLYLYVNR